ncbi:hypothetical protein JW968_01185 [Candidatus Woesearchaeota archaeon]|nr:hypothetical protein [Candidatus Woesearchaeota archaeon]
MDIIDLFFNITIGVICLLILSGFYMGIVKKSYRLMFGLIVFGLVLLALTLFMISGILG